MAIVWEEGIFLDQFLIFACISINWPELKREMNPGQSPYYYHPDVICGVFKQEWEAVKHEIVLTKKQPTTNWHPSTHDLFSQSSFFQKYLIPYSAIIQELDASFLQIFITTHLLSFLLKQHGIYFSKYFFVTSLNYCGVSRGLRIIKWFQKLMPHLAHQILIIQ